MDEYLDMISILRSRKSPGFQEWCQRYIEDLGGYYDGYGNYIVEVDAGTGVLISVHLDTVIPKGYSASQNPIYTWKDGGHWFVRGNGESVLGADDTNGVWIARQLVKAKFPATYIFHQDEEIGLLGADYIAKTSSSWLSTFHTAIAIDRRGYQDCITHMNGQQVCTFPFANYLSAQLDLIPSDRGFSTDVLLYHDFIPNCTNISCGYFYAHTNYEYADFTFCEQLLQKLLQLDVEKLAAFGC